MKQRPLTYRYRTPVGTFVIKPSHADPKSVELWLGDECYGQYATAQTAASDVFCHATGFHQWDVATHLEASEDLGDWQVS